MSNYILTISKPCAAALWVLSVATALRRNDFLLCSHPEHEVALHAPHAPTYMEQGLVMIQGRKQRVRGGCAPGGMH